MTFVVAFVIPVAVIKRDEVPVTCAEEPCEVAEACEVVVPCDVAVLLCDPLTLVALLHLGDVSALILDCFVDTNPLAFA